MKRIRIIALSFILSLFGIVTLNSCAQPHSHEWAKEWSSDNAKHWLECPECEEKFNIGDHTYGDPTYVKETNKFVYTCTVCGHEKGVDHNSHTKSACTCIDDVFHKYTCNDCGEEITEHHTVALDRIENGIEAIYKCTTCNYEIKMDLIQFNEVEGGTAEYLYSNEDFHVIRAIPKEGYYFKQWSIVKKDFVKKKSNNSLFEEGENYTSEKYSAVEVISFSRPTANNITIYNIEPIFTTINPQIEELEIEINVENNIKVDYEITYYKDNEGTPYAGIYFPKNDDVVLSDQLEFAEIVIGDDEIHTLPYAFNECLDGNMRGKLEKLQLTFTDIRDKALVSVYYQINGENYGYISGDVLFRSLNAPTYYVICDKKNPVNLHMGAQFITNKNNENKYYYCEKWIDEEGNVYSTNKCFEDVFDSNTTLIAVMKQADEIIDIDLFTKLLFSKNSDNTLTFEGVSNDITNINIPETVNGLTVTGIGNYSLVAPERGNIALTTEDITVPETVVNFGEGAFANAKYNSITIIGDKTNLTFDMFRNEELARNPFRLGLAQQIKIDVTYSTMDHMVQNLVKTFIDDVEINITFASEQTMGQGTKGFYQSCSTNVYILDEGYFTYETLCVLPHELRHFYQEVALGWVEGLSINDLKIQPEYDQVGQWKYIEYVPAETDYYAYWFNPREVDSRNFAAQVMGVDLYEEYIYLEIEGYQE